MLPSLTITLSQPLHFQITTQPHVAQKSHFFSGGREAQGSQDPCTKMCLKAAESWGSGQRGLIGCSCSPQGPCARPHSSSVEEKNKTQQCAAPTTSSLLPPLPVSFKCQGGGGDAGSWRPHNLVSVSLSVFKTKVNYLHASTWVRPHSSV